MVSNEELADSDLKSDQDCCDNEVVCGIIDDCMGEEDDDTDEEEDDDDDEDDNDRLGVAVT